MVEGYVVIVSLTLFDPLKGALLQSPNHYESCIMAEAYLENNE